MSKNNNVTVKEMNRITGLHNVIQANLTDSDMFHGNHVYSLVSRKNESLTDIYCSNNTPNIDMLNTKPLITLQNAGHTQSLNTMMSYYWSLSRYLLVGYNYQTPNYQNHGGIKWSNSIICLPINTGDDNSTTIVSDFSKYKRIIGLDKVLEKVMKYHYNHTHNVVNPFANYGGQTVDPDANHVTDKIKSPFILRSECGISSDGNTFYVAINDIYHDLYVVTYPEPDIRNAVNNSNIVDLSYFDFDPENDANRWAYISYDQLKSITHSSSFSFQGFGMDNTGNLYISSEFGPKYKDKYSDIPDNHKRFIVKIADLSENSRNWTVIDLTSNPTISASHLITEFEGIQVTDVNKILLTVAYHYNEEIVDSNPRYPRSSVIYEITW